MDQRRQMPNMGGQFHGQNQQAKPTASTGFSLMNIVPVYTLLVVGYAIYIWFKVKGRKDEETSESKSTAKKTEIEELKDRLARTEAALNKLVEATTQLQKNMPEEELQKIFSTEPADNDDAPDKTSDKDEEEEDNEINCSNNSAEESEEEQSNENDSPIETLKNLSHIEDDEDEPQVINIDSNIDEKAESDDTQVRKRIVASE